MRQRFRRNRICSSQNYHTSQKLGRRYDRFRRKESEKYPFVMCFGTLVRISKEIEIEENNLKIAML